MLVRSRVRERERERERERGTNKVCRSGERRVGESVRPGVDLGGGRMIKKKIS